MPIRLVLAAALWFVIAPRVVAQASIPTYGVSEEVRIESNDSVPGMLLTGVERLAVLPDGRMLTSHPREAVIRVFDSSGRLINLVGRRGDGPGEFRGLRQAGYVGDRFWAEDTRWHRYMIFDARTYELVGTVAMGPTSGSFKGLTSDTTSLVQTGAGNSERVGIYGRTGQRRMAIDVAIRLAGHRFGMQVQEISPGGFRTGRTVAQTVGSPLHTFTQLSLAPGGRELVVLEASELWNGPPGQFTIRRFETATGRVTTPVTVSLPARRVTSSETDSLITLMTPAIRSRVAREPRLVAQYRAKAEVPEVFPAFRALRAVRRWRAVADRVCQSRYAARRRPHRDRRDVIGLDHRRSRVVRGWELLQVALVRHRC